MALLIESVRPKVEIVAVALLGDRAPHDHGPTCAGDIGRGRESGHPASDDNRVDTW